MTMNTIMYSGTQRENNMLVDVVWKSYHKKTPNRGYWDMAFLERVFAKKVWRIGYDFVHRNDFGEVENDGAIVIIPAAYHANEIDKINEDISKLRWCLFIVAGDENGFFPSDKLKHPNMKVWLMTPHPEKDLHNIDRFIGEGPAPDAYEFIQQNAREAEKRFYNFSFSGQVTHERRTDCALALEKLPNGFLNKTAGFTQGLNHQQYYELMANSKVIPCPSGPGTPDSFRFFEALEAGCVPIADSRTPRDSEPTRYWNLLFGENLPFPVIDSWEAQAKDMIQYHVDVWPKTANEIFAWWQGYKRNFVLGLEDDICELSGVEPKRGKVTVLIPTSPIPSHPSTDVIMETLQTLITSMSGSLITEDDGIEVIIMIDGVREEQKETHEKNYQEYIRRLLWQCNHHAVNALPVVFKEHHHQAAMTKEVLKMVRTPQILFVEHDTPVTPDRKIEWNKLVKVIEDKHANMIRFHFESVIPEPHKPLMLSQEPEQVGDVKLLPTAQWSQRPHLASTEFYKHILETYFSPNSRTMIEDKMHGVLINAWEERQRAGWNEFKVYIYAPSDDYKRSYHLDGRQTDPKYDMTF